MRKERSYIQPSCTLEVWWQASPLQSWLDREVAQSIGFRLCLEDQSIEGDQELLERFLHDVEHYVQRFLTKEHALPSIHTVMGLRLSTLQLVDVSNALEALVAEISLVPVLPTAPADADLSRSVAVGIFSVLSGICLGAWLASRSAREPVSPLAPVVVAPSPTPSTAFATPFVVPTPTPSASPLPVSPGVKPTPPSVLPPVRVYPRPLPSPTALEEALRKSPPLEKPAEAPGITPSPAIVPSVPRSENEFAKSQPSELRGAAPPLPEAPSKTLVKSDLSYRRIQIQQVELSSSPELTQSFLEHLQVLPVDSSVEPGLLTIDLSVEMGQINRLNLENATITKPESLQLLEEAIRSWTPAPQQTGLVRIQVQVP